MTYHSNFSKVVALFAKINWGIQVLALESPFFLGEQKGKKIAFQALLIEDYTKEINIDVNKNTDYLCLGFRNKPGANLVLLRTKDVINIVSKPFEVKEIVEHIKVKEEIEFNG